MKIRSIILAFFLFPIFVLSQQDSTISINEINEPKFLFEIFYGAGLPVNKNIDIVFNNTGNFNSEISILLQGLNHFFPGSGMKLNEYFKFGIDIGYYSNKLYILTSQNEKINSKLISIKPEVFYTWGFEFKNFKLIPYVNIPIYNLFNNLNFFSYKTNLDIDTKNLELFSENVKAGYSRNNGLMINLYNKYVINLNYEHSLIYPKHLMLKDLGSWSIDVGSYLSANILSFLFFNPEKKTLTNKIGFIVMNYILQSSASLGMQLIRKSKGMNWPFTSEKPLSIESFRIGAGIIF